MVSVQLPTFSGIAPKIQRSKLGETIAQTAHNCLLDSGSLVPLGASTDTAINITSGTDTLYRHVARNGTVRWLQFATDNVHVVESPVVANALESLYWTQPDEATSYPQVSWVSQFTGTAPAVTLNGFRLRVPAPTAAPAISVAIAGTVDPDAILEDVSWIYTLVTGDGREGPPSPATTIQSDILMGNGTDLHACTLTLPTTFGGANTTYTLNNYETGAVIRIYRTNTGTQSTGFQYVGEAAITAGTYVDVVPSSQLAEVLSTTEWQGPPDDLEGLTDMGNGILAGFADNTLYFSEPYLPHAWPTANAVPIASEIVGIKASPQGLVVGTDENPYIVQGTSPNAMRPIRLTSRQSCASRRSMVEMEGYVIYASPDGLMAVDGNDVINLTEETHDRADWQLLQPALMVGFYYEGRYVGYNGDLVDSIIVDVRGGANAFTTTDLITSVGFSDITTDMLYFKNATNDLVTFNTGAYGSMTWISKEFDIGVETSMSCGQIYADGTVTMTLTGDDIAQDTNLSITSADQFRLSTPLITYRIMEVKLVSSDIIHWCRLATSPNDMIAGS